MRSGRAGRAAQGPGTFFESNYDFHFHIDEGHYPNPPNQARILCVGPTVPGIDPTVGECYLLITRDGKAATQP